MGCLRLLLAVFVVVEHAPLFGRLTLVGGNVAVEMFFMLSGFYMALVLDGKYGTSTSRDIRSFYLSRFLRLWPTFLLTTLAVHGWWLFHRIRLGHEPMSAGPILEWAGPWFASFVRFSNLFMIGQDVPSWFHVDETHGARLTFGVPETLADGSLWAGYAREIGPAWSIGTEIWFYLAAPFLVRLGTVALTMLATAGLALRFYMEGVGDMLAYFVFPAQLPLFLAGMLAYRWRDLAVFSHRAMFALPIATLTLWTIAIVALKLDQSLKWLVYGLVVLGIPQLFRMTKDWRFDRAIGELSYPIYIIHALVLNVAQAVGRRVGVPVTGELLLALVVPLAYAIYRFVERPIDHWRQSWVERRGRASRSLGRS